MIFGLSVSADREGGIIRMGDIRSFPSTIVKLQILKYVCVPTVPLWKIYGCKIHSFRVIVQQPYYNGYNTFLSGLSSSINVWHFQRPAGLRALPVLQYFKNPSNQNDRYKKMNA